jgi:hypothetical protein
MPPRGMFEGHTSRTAAGTRPQHGAGGGVSLFYKLLAILHRRNVFFIFLMCNMHGWVLIITEQSEGEAPSFDKIPTP